MNQFKLDQNQYSLTPRINVDSIGAVRKMIEQKIGDRPFLASEKNIIPVLTDMDHHPYTRFFRGVYYFPSPIIFEREAGWRPRHDNCYRLNIPPQKDKPPHHCFEIPCSTILPCYPEYLTKYADRENLDVMINNTCIVQYR